MRGVSVYWLMSPKMLVISKIKPMIDNDGRNVYFPLSSRCSIFSVLVLANLSTYCSRFFGRFLGIELAINTQIVEKKVG